MEERYSSPHSATRRVLLLLALVWVTMTFVALAFVVAFGSNAPYADEWEFVPALVGREPLSTWIWAQHNEHRLPLSRSIYYALFRATGDFRAGMFLQVGLLSGLSLGLMRLAGRLRGYPVWSDAFFPISLLHVGHWENLVMGYQLCFALFCCLVSTLAAVVLQTRREIAFRTAIVAGALLVAIALTGGFGLPVVPPVSAWLVYLAVLQWRLGKVGRSLGIVALAILPLVYMAIYFMDYERPPHHPPPSRDPAAVGMVAGEVLAMAFGIGLSGVWWLIALAEIAVGVATVVLLLSSARDPAERPASTGTIAVAAGVCGLTLAIGFGRGSMGDDMGLWSRYSLLSWPLLGSAYLVWAKAGRKWLPIGFCVVAALAFTPNMLTGMRWGPPIRENYKQIESDERSGCSAEEIVRRRFPDSVNAGQMERGIVAIPLLREARIGAFGAGQR